MQMKMKYAAIALLLAGTPALAAPPPRQPAAPAAPQEAAPDETLQDATNAFQAWVPVNNYMAKEANALANAYRAVKAENAQSKAENAQLKAEIAQLKEAANTAPVSPPAPGPTPAMPSAPAQPPVPAPAPQ